MSSIRKFTYATLLALTTLSFMPSLASAQEKARGNFTLSHDVHWADALVPAGDYQFRVEVEGATSMLVLRKVSGAQAGFLLRVNDADEIGAAGANRLELSTLHQGSYVTAMQLPQFGMTLRFRVPSEAQKQIAKAATTATALGQ